MTGLEMYFESQELERPASDDYLAEDDLILDLSYSSLKKN